VIQFSSKKNNFFLRNAQLSRKAAERLFRLSEQQVLEGRLLET
jgi:hypothetical protein